MSRKVTLIMPCYNAETHIDVMLASVYGQLHDDIELICIDDGSTDNTRAKLDAWKPIIEKRGYTMTVVSKKNGGAASAINVGLSLMTGDYICFPDNDDMLMPGYASKMLNYLEEHRKMQWVKCGCIMEDLSKLHYPRIKSQLKQYNNALSKRHLLELTISGRVPAVVWTIMVRRSFFEECFPDMKIDEGGVSQEYQMIFPLTAKARYGYIDEPLYAYLHSRTYGDNHRNKSYESEALYLASLSAMAKKIANKLGKTEDQKKKWVLMCNIAYIYRCIAAARRHNESESLKQLIGELFTQIKPIIRLESDLINIETLQEIPNRVITFLAYGALDKLMYTANEFAQLITPKMLKQFEDLQTNDVHVYGAGWLGQVIVHILLYMDIMPKQIFDKNSDKIGDSIYGIPIVSPEFDSLSAREKQDMLVVVAILDANVHEEVAKLLIADGIQKIEPGDDLIDTLQILAAANGENKGSQIS